MAAKGIATPYREPRNKNLDPVIYALRKRRYEKGLSITALAEKMGYDHRVLAGWECGARTPLYRSMKDWCQALGVTLRVGEE